MRVAIMGGGQLARMLAQSGRPLGHEFVFYANSTEEARPVQNLGDQVIAQQGRNGQQIYEALGKPGVITVESENTDTALLTELSEFCPVMPCISAVYNTQHRYRERKWLSSLGIPTADFEKATSLSEIKSIVAKMGYKAVIKSCENGYDGKNQAHITEPSHLSEFEQSYVEGTEFIVEKHVNFICEVSLVATRSASGEVCFYPLAKNYHRSGILLTSVPVIEGELIKYSDQAKDYLTRLVEDVDYVGTMAMECFVTEDNLLVNELAPRVHNSGHWTQEGCQTSQFENHIRAITGDELGSVELTQPTAMLNLLGVEVNESQINDEQATLHWYDKTVKPGRKVGHINIQRETMEALEAAVNDLKKQIYTAS